jgi:maltose/maltodextrin transport system permease protein
MLLIVNVWLGFPYMMVLCSGLIKSDPGRPVRGQRGGRRRRRWVNFRAITLPLILKPLTPLLISAFAFNFNNFVLISCSPAAGPTSSTPRCRPAPPTSWSATPGASPSRTAGQQFGLASAISTVIFLIVAAITLVQMRFTRIAADEPGK